MFIVFEGGEGAGKTTHINLLKTYLEKKGRKVLITREPGGTAIGERIRDILLDIHADFDSYTEAYLLAASRARHVRETIRPALEKGMDVISDRYIYSSYAYQGYGRELGLDVIKDINKHAIDGLYPDKVILLSIPAPIGVVRARQTKAGGDRIDRASMDFHARVNRGFKEIQDENWSVIDVDNPIEWVHEKVIDAISDFL